MLKENLTAHELEEYAKKNGYDSVKFVCVVKEGGEVKGAPFTGQFLDAYYGFVKIPLLGDGFARLQDLQEAHGDRNLYFHIPENDDEYYAAETVGFVLRGKEPPKRG